MFRYIYVSLVSLMFLNHDLISQPGIQATGLTFTNITPNSMTLSWTNGNGTRRLVVGKQISGCCPTPPDTPINSEDYTANSSFGSGDVIGTSFVLFKGVASTVSITGLNVSTSYYFWVFEFDGSGSSTLYNTTNLFWSGNPAMTNTMDVEPTIQSTTITFSNITTTSLDLNYTNGNGFDRLVLVKSGSPVDALPQDGIFYSYNSQFGSGSEIGTGNFVVGGGSGGITVTGLTAGTTYYFRVFEYNSGPNYLTSTATGNPASRSTVLNQPTTQASSLVLSSRTSNSITINWTNGNGSQRIVLARSGSTNPINPTDGSTYTANSDFSLAQDIGSGSKVVFKGTGSSVTLTNLSSVQSYTFVVMEFNGSGGTENYNTTIQNGVNRNIYSTIAAEPTIQDSNISFSSISTNSLQLSWTNGNGAGRIIVARASSTVNFTPTDETDVSSFANTNFGAAADMGNGNKIVYNGSGTSVFISGLGSNTTYYFRIYNYNGSGTLINYFTSPGISNNPNLTVTLATEPTTQTTSLVPSSIGAISLSLGFTNGNGTNRLIVARQASAVSNFPIDGVSYTANSNFGSGSTTGTGQFVVFSGGNGPITVTGLTPNTTYHFRSFEYNGSGGSSNYYTNTATLNPISQTTATLASEPATQASNLVVESVWSDSLRINFTNGNGTSRLVVAKLGSVIDSNPVDGTTYTVHTTFGSGSQIGTGNFVVGSGSGPITIRGLIPGVIYHFRIYEFNGTSGVQNYNVTTGVGNPSSFSTAVTEPTQQASNIDYNSITTTSMTINWANGNGTERLVLAKASSSIDVNPSDGSSYTGNSNFVSAVDIGSSNKVVYRGNGSSAPVTNLAPNTVYHFRVYELNGSDLQTNYLIATASGNPSSRSTLAPEPSAQPTSLIFNNVEASSFTVNFTTASGSPSGYIAVRREDFAPTTDPIDGTAYTAGTSLGNGTIVYTGSSTSFNQTGLASDKIYHYKVYSYNGSGVTLNYRQTSPLQGSQSTLSAEPSTQASNVSFSAPTSNSLTVGWTNGNGAERLVVAREASAVSINPTDGVAFIGNSNFSAAMDLGSGNKVVYRGTGNSVNVTNLTANTVYHFRVYELNGSGSLTNYLINTATNNPNNRPTFATEPSSQPTNLTFSNVDASSLTVNFTAAFGSPSGYLAIRRESTAPTTDPADGTAYTTGSTLGNGTVVHAGSATSFNDNNGLAAGTIYYYKIYSYNGSGQSINYLSSSPLQGSKITLPAKPSIALSNATSSNFYVSWSAVQSASGYKVDVSTTSSFSSLIAGYDPLVVGITPPLEVNVTGLQPLTEYFVRVRAVNGSGDSENSDWSSITTQAIGSTGSLSIGSVSQSTQGSNVTLTVTLTNVSSGPVVKFFSRKIIGSTFSESTLTPSSGSTYQATVTPTMLDELGLEYYFTATDASTPTPKQTAIGYVYTPFAAGSKTIANLSFGGQVKNYRIISVPYDLENKDVLAIFGVLGQYDATKWRLIQYQGGYKDYPSFTQLTLGKGYWFNAKEQVSISLGAGTAPKFNQDSPFTLSLTQGWNLIGNPYPFNIDWSDILEANGNPSSIPNEYFVFNPNTLSYDKSNSLKPFEGGWVLANQNINLTVPVTLKNTAGGRQKADDTFTESLDELNWLVPVTLKQGEMTNTLSALGMHPEASVSHDRYDGIAPPYFFEYTQLTSDHPEYFIPQFVRDVVPTQKDYVWSFTLESNRSGPVELQWDREAIKGNKAQLLLYDPFEGALLDMRLIDKHIIQNANGRQIQFVYSRDEYAVLNTHVGRAYPNPFTDEVKLPGYFNATGDDIHTSVSILNSTGIEVYRQEIKFNSKGLIQPVWNGATNREEGLPAGVYIFRVMFNSGNRIVSNQGKVVKR